MKIQNILLIEDSEVDRFYARWLLSDVLPEVEIVEAHDGVEALNYLNICEVMPDLIFVDVNMPRMNGFSFLSEYEKKRLWTAPIFLLTSSKHESDMNKANTFSSLSGYIPKPLSDNSVLSCIETVSQS